MTKQFKCLDCGSLTHIRSCPNCEDGKVVERDSWKAKTPAEKINILDKC